VPVWGSGDLLEVGLGTEVGLETGVRLGVDLETGVGLDNGLDKAAALLLALYNCLCNAYN
jgi:hypothetical protein